MHFHLPKPLHGWREFAGEVGIIVLGVLIALSAEQLVETVHQHELAREAESSIRTELAYNAAFAAERVAIGECMRSSIRDLQKRLLASGDAWTGLQNTPIDGAPRSPSTRPLFAFPPPFSSPHRLWPTSAWETAKGSGALNRIARDRFARFAYLYAMVDGLDRLQDHEVGDHARLMPFGVAQKLDPSSRLQLLTALGAVDAENADIERLAAVFVTAARRNGIPPDKDWLRRALQPEAALRGTCVKQGADLDLAIALEFGGGLRV